MPRLKYSIEYGIILVLGNNNNLQELALRICLLACGTRASVCTFDPPASRAARWQGFSSLCASPAVSHEAERGSRGSLIMTRHVGGVERRRRWEREGFWPRQALFSPRSPGHGTPAGTHLIIHPVRVPRSKWHSNKFRVTGCEVLKSYFFFHNAAEKKVSPGKSICAAFFFGVCSLN